MVKEIIEKIIDGCNEVKKNPEIHKDAKTLATLVIKDCNDALKKEWVGLTGDEVQNLTHRKISPWIWLLLKEFETKLKEKNNG